MRCLRPFLENQYVQRIISACRESPAVQGILLQIDPLWMLAWRIGESVDPTDPQQGFEEALKRGNQSLFSLIHYFSLTSDYRLTPWRPFRAITEKDLSWRPSDWPVAGFYAQWPAIMRICLYPGRGEPPLFRGDGFQIRYEVRPIAEVYASPKDQHRPLLGGVSVGVNSTDAGTMGGILVDRKGNYFGVTCGHVVGSVLSVEQPARIDRTGTLIGKVDAVQVPAPFPSHARKVSADQQKYAAKVDAALIEIDSGISAELKVLKMGRVTDFVAIDDIEQDEELQMTGRTSDWQKIQRSSVSPFYNVTNKTTGDEYCYENALIFREPSGAAAAQAGDSGAWICKEVGSVYHWAGMIVGGDKQLGIAIAAAELKTWWEALPTGYDLSVY